jgi:hypothetical protein
MRSDRVRFHVLVIGCVLSVAFRNGAMYASQAAQSPMILSKGVASFNVRGLCLVDALLTLGQEEQVPLGIEYISREALAGCGKTLHGCHPERSEGSRSAYLLENAQGQILLPHGGIRMTVSKSFSAACEAPPFPQI